MYFKRLFIVLVAAWTLQAPVMAQKWASDSLGVFNHLGVGVVLGTSGISLELATPITQYLVLRGGMNVLKKFYYNTTLGAVMSGNEYMDTAADIASDYGVDVLNPKIQGTFKLTKAHLLMDIYPWKRLGFHFTVGAYLGHKRFLKARNREEGVLMPITQYNAISRQMGYQEIGYQMGDYYLTPDEQGNIEAQVKVNPVRPYVGVGFSRSLSSKHPFTVSFDLGMQIWGEPEVWMDGEKLSKSGTHGSDGGVISFVNSMFCWPVLNVRLMGRIF